MKALNILYAFLGGAIVGCSAAILLAPEKGADVRAKICDASERLCALLKKKGIKISDAEVDALVAELANAEE